MIAIAKYLPVEGEIREGGLYFNEHNHLTAYAGISKPDDKCKKVELFAVTQEGISNGDKVWDELRKTYWTRSDKITCNGEIYWKVLGELSPNATWVKEGDEIKIKEGWDQWDGPEGIDSVVCQVLGPCGHYH